ncbi:MAG TPA: NAD(P)-dependent alcohol dehydrogenase [Candidatus Limnocylindrales bacterium]|nr:NAD(P)-dependent alcohol dehydrogenase [Candidatus Limnocylindrales bacterium]
MTQAPPTTMRAAVRDRYGPPEVVHLDDVERPTPIGDQVLVRVHAASVNRADLDGLYPRWQFIRLFTGVRAPRLRRIGLDVSGVVEAVGPAVTRFRPGDRVFADLYQYGNGAFAEFACAPERAFETIPPEMAFEDAATLPHAAVLALQGLRLRDGRTVGPGDRVIVVGASGNVGPFAVQIAISRGAEVTGVCRTKKADFVRSLGVDDVIDYTKVDYTTSGRRWDWILDVEARHSILRSRHALRPGGAYVSLGGPASMLLDGFLTGLAVSRATSRSMGLMTWWKPFLADDVTTLKELYATGALKPVIDRRFPLSEVVAALRWVDDGKAMGKVVVTI